MLHDVNFAVRCTHTRISGSVGAPGNSVSEMGERMNGGAVSDERSPETEAILACASGTVSTSTHAV